MKGVLHPLGDLEGCVHGGHLFCAISPSFTVSSGHQLLLPPGSEEASRAEQKQILGLFLEIERSIVLPRCVNPSAREFFPDHTRRLVNYLDAAKNLLQLLRHPAVASGELHDRAKHILDTAMSALAKEFCNLRIWRDHLGVSSASIRELVRASNSGCCSASSSATWSSSSDPFSGSSGTNGAGFDSFLAPLGEDLTVQSNSAFSGASHIDLKSLSILDDIAGVMIVGGYEQMLRGALDRGCAHLARHVEILDIDNILGSHMEESGEKLMKVWVFAMRIIISVLVKMQRQLDGHDFVCFNTFKEDYFMAIAKITVKKLLNSASSLCIQVGPPNDHDPSCKDSYAELKHALSKMINVVMMFQALDYAMQAISTLFLGKTLEFILAEAEGLIHGLSATLLNLFVELNNLLRSQQLLITDTGVHRVTWHIMEHIRFLVEQKNTLYLMLINNPDKFCQLVKQLISSLEFILHMSSRSLGLQGQQQVFLLNNVHFMLEQAKNKDVGLILGESWLLQRRDNVDQYITSYVEASWAPVMSSFERRTRVPKILWHHQLFDKFTSSFEMTHNLQKAWKVTDPQMRENVRRAVAQKVIPLYRMHMENNSEKKHKSAKYSIEQLESQLLEMFEG